MVCNNGCYDEPQRQKGAKPVTADPLPILNARPEPFTTTGFSYDESNIMVMPPPSIKLGAATDGAQMLMPDGVTVMLMPDGSTTGVPTYSPSKVYSVVTDTGDAVVTDTGQPVVWGP